MPNNNIINSTGISSRCIKRLSGSLYRFIQLVDTPEEYTNQAGKIVVVNDAEDGLAFLDFGNLDTSYLVDSTVYNCPNGLSVNQFITITSDTNVGIASKDDIASLPVVGVIIGKPTTTTCIIQTLGYVDGFTGLVPGDTYYLGNGGNITNSATIVSGEALYPVGVAKSTTKLELRIDSSYIVRG